MLDQFRDKSPGARSWIENFHMSIDKLLAEILLAQPVCAFDHEAYDLVRRIETSAALLLITA